MSGASPEGTQRYFSRYPLPVAGEQPGTLGRTGWNVSPVGFGSYRVHDSEPVHREALTLALTSGCNLIDTSTNYMNGSSEKLIGSVLSELFQDGRLQRDEVVLVTKAGYVQGDQLALARQRAAEGNPFPEMVEYHSDCWHCISPEFLEDQITRSLSRLRVTTLDVLLLHNPEYFLKTDPNHSEYYRRIRQAFVHLEREVAHGRIQYYGISSNTFPDPKDSPEYTSLEAVVEIAQEVDPGNHFAVIEFPLNLYEPGAVFEANNTGASVNELAAAKRIGTLINRPLNAFFGNHLIRLADFPAHEGRDVEKDLSTALSRAMEAESRYPTDNPLKDVLPLNRILWGHVLQKNFEQLSDISQWRQILDYQIRPSLKQSLELLMTRPETQPWATDYKDLAEQLFDAFTAYMEARASHQSQALSGALEQACPPLKSSVTLSQKAIRVYHSIPGIDCVLVGMRRPDYVRDVLTLEPKLRPEEAIDAMDAAERSIEP